MIKGWQSSIMLPSSDFIRIGAFKLDTKIASTLVLMFHSEVFPPGFVNETLRTLALLFPQSDEELRQWVKDLPSDVDKSVRMCGHLGADARQIENFHYWHDRLVVLKQVFDEGEP